MSDVLALQELPTESEFPQTGGSPANTNSGVTSTCSTAWRTTGVCIV